MRTVRAIVVSHDSHAVLPHCLDSLRMAAGELDPGALEVVVVDNASRDGSLELVRERYPELAALPCAENRGFAAGCNAGAAGARADALLFLNPDARLEAGALRALAAKLGADPRLGAVAPELAYPDGRLQFAWSPDRSVLGELVQKLRNRFEGALWNHRALPAVWRALVGPGWYSAACLLVRRTAFEEVGGFDEGYFLYFEDADLCVRLRRAGWRLAQERAARAVHLCGASSGAGPTRAAYRDSQLRFYKAHRPRWEQRLVTRRAARRRQR